MKKEAYQILTEKEIYRGNLILVNEKFGIRADESIRLAEAAPNVFLQHEAAHFLKEALKKIKAEDSIALVSGFRSRREQSEIYKMSLSENGEAFTRQYVALPDHSEHQTGLAIDLALKSDDIDFIRPDFPFEGICQRFREIAAEYGFIQRYPKEKENITGIAFEPWHFRYVGKPHAEIMERYGLTLEEYTDLVKDYDSFNRLKLNGDSAEEVFYIEFGLQSGEMKIPVSEKESCTVSGDNRGGFIVTVTKFERT
ncbi:MAG: M15 family metallopeptidase [Ruminococcaceae bacterium]|nr:M15 family metallopeptidase [Oscillospiraceae bacterium]